VTLISDELREFVVRRAGDRCEYCHLPQASQVATFPVDHVIPAVRHGPTDPDNLCLACPRCNALKWTRVDAADPASGELVSLFNPRRDDWDTHFRWSQADTSILEGLTPRARATIALLELNSTRRITIRRWLTAAQNYPLA
jgi:hypothetical protein